MSSFLCSKHFLHNSFLVTRFDHIKAGSKLNVLTFTGDQHSISVFNVSVGLKPVRESCRQMVLHICFVLVSIPSWRWSVDRWLRSYSIYSVTMGKRNRQTWVWWLSTFLLDGMEIKSPLILLASNSALSILSPIKFIMQTPLIITTYNSNIWLQIEVYFRLIYSIVF